MTVTRNYRLLIQATLLLAASQALADIRYDVEVRPENRLLVRMSFPVKTSEFELQMPNWAPGAYRLGDNAGKVQELAASNGTLSKVNANTWKVSGVTAKDVIVSYTVGPIQNNDGGYHYSGPPTYFYVVGRKGEKCILRVHMPEDWKLAVGLDEVKSEQNTFKAHDYDTLADNPVSLGDIWIDSYSVQGKPHYIAIRGKLREKMDKEYLKKACKFVTEMQVDFFKDLPYNKYVWHFTGFEAPDGAGGLEHLSSTQISLATGLGPRAVSVLSHEFFHLWNVKRIRAKMLGPFDYNALPKTGSLWWLEGVTDYFAHRLLHDYRWWDRTAFYKDIADNVRTVRSNAAHTEVGPNESSFRMPETNNGTGNSNGYKLSYYNLGWLAGLCLDTEIRSLTKNKKSLDDVIRNLYSKTRDNKPGFEEDEIRRQCIAVGGPTMGDFYDRVVMRPGPMPIEEQLAKFGLQLTTADEPYTDVGFGINTFGVERGATVRDVKPSASALQNGDIIVAVNGVALDKASGRENGEIVNKVVTAAKPGTVIKLQIKRSENQMDVEVVAVGATRKVWLVQENPGSSPEKAALEVWLRPRIATLRGVKVGERGRG